MFKRLEMWNFRKIEHDVMHFDEGLNVIRGPNEASKSTRFEAITYAFFGVKGLKESLAETVTYFKPEASLKVELNFHVAGIDYHIKRSKSGSELTFGTDTVTGVNDVTRKVEEILGCPADVACKLMLAKQSAIKGSLEEGPAASVKLIEVLANFELIDTLLELVEAKLPSGNTKITEARLEQLTQDAAEVVEADNAALLTAVNKAEMAAEAHKLFVVAIEESIKELDTATAKAHVLEYQQLSTRLTALEGNLEEVTKALQIPLPDQVDISVLPTLREKEADKKKQVSALALLNKLQAANIEPLWEGDITSLQAEVTKYDTANKNCKEQIQETKLQIRSLQGKLVKELSCAFCGKDLKDIPEVAKVNNALTPQIEALEGQVKVWELEYAEGANTLTDLNGAVFKHVKTEQLYAECREYITLDTSTVPSSFIWRGPTLLDDTDYQSQISILEKADQTYLAAKVRNEVNTKRLADMTKTQVELKEALLSVPLKQATETLALHEKRKADFDAAINRSQQESQNLAAARASLSQVLAVQAEASKRVDAAKALLLSTQKDLSEMVENNILIKKLRNARPQIADKLWSIVLASVSHYFSQMRGIASVVTRSDNGFQVNGQSVKGLSGSTLDILGLSIRIALTRTFLPNVQFLCLDEAAAGCDDERETALIGLVTACDFSQVLLVTHSSLADAFAAKIITLGG